MGADCKAAKEPPGHLLQDRSGAHAAIDSGRWKAEPTPSRRQQCKTTSEAATVSPCAPSLTLSDSPAACQLGPLSIASPQALCRALSSLPQPHSRRRRPRAPLLSAAQVQHEGALRTRRRPRRRAAATARRGQRAAAHRGWLPAPTGPLRGRQAAAPIGELGGSSAPGVSLGQAQQTGTRGTCPPFPATTTPPTPALAHGTAQPLCSDLTCRYLQFASGAGGSGPEDTPPVLTGEELASLEALFYEVAPVLLFPPKHPLPIA